MPARNLLHLQAGEVELELCPEIGGAIARFRHRSRDVMRPAPPDLLERGEPRLAASFPLVPFSGRIADGRFRFRGEAFQLSPNLWSEPHAIHGQGWQHPWQVAEASTRRAVLSFDHEVPATRLHYHARQELELSDHGLHLTLELTNTGDRAMPAGLGLHPYFVRTAGVTLETRLDQVWLTDLRKIPRERVPLPQAWDFARAPQIATLEMDHCFGGWDGHATIRWPEIDLTLRIEAEPVFGHLVIYIPAGADFFCVEPVSHASDGFNLLERGVEGTGIRVLEPGERLRGACRFIVI